MHDDEYSLVLLQSSDADLEVILYVHDDADADDLTDCHHSPAWRHRAEESLFVSCKHLDLVQNVPLIPCPHRMLGQVEF